MKPSVLVGLGVAVLYFVMFANRLDQLITLAMESVCRVQIEALECVFRSNSQLSLAQASFNAVFKLSSDAATT